MRIAMTGSSGMVGTAVRKRLEADGHEVIRFTRGKADHPAATWDPAAGWIRPGALDGIDAIIHLAGESIGDGRWSDARKRALRTSRIDTTRLLVSEMRKQATPPALITASAIGIYGDRGDEILDESSTRGRGFLADLVNDWEAAAMAAKEFGARVVALRLGVVLDAKGGALPRMAMPFKFGAGGRLGSGKQWFSWVTLDDAVSAFVRALQPDMEGVYNVTSPHPVTNRELTRSLARTLRRPALFPAPRFALRLALGESADELLFASQRVLPRRLEAAGFAFRHPDIDEALRAVLKGG